MSLYKRGTVWWSRIERNGKPIQRSTKGTGKENARKVESAWRTADALGAAGLLTTNRKVTPLCPLRAGQALELRASPNPAMRYPWSIGPMFREGSLISAIKTVVLGVALVACQCGAQAQHGGGAPGGGGSGGGSAGGGGLSGGAGRATGVSVKDDLKDFREVLAVQASSQQIIQYAAMMRSAAAASAELQSFLEQAGKPNPGAELAGRCATLDQALERARTENKKFLDGLTERQKSGLKEIAKRLTKWDSDLEQQAKALDQTVADARVVGQQLPGSAQNLERALANFRSQQADLGEEMSIRSAIGNADSAFNLPPVKNSFNFGTQPIAVTTSEVISQGVAEGGQQTFKVELTADISDLQQNFTQVLRALLNKADRCGEQIAIRNAALTPLPPAGLVMVQLHYERWACFGRDTQNEMAEGNGTIEVKLTPAVADDGTLRLLVEIRRIDAEGMVGELLRSGSVGDALRETVTHLLLSTMSQGGDFKATLPPSAQGYATLRRAQFQGTGAGKLRAVLDGEIRVSNEKATALTSELKGRSASPDNAPETVPR